MRRRDFLGLLGGATLQPLASHGQDTAKVPKIGLLLANSEEEEKQQGVGEAFLAERGFDVAERFEVSLVLEFADAELYARGVASSGPAYESIQSIGDEQFRVRAEELAASHARDGLPLRGIIQVFGYLGTKR